MDDKVWIVGYRDYDGFNIKDVYSNKPEADKYAELLNETEGNNCVDIDLEDGIGYFAIEKSVLDKCTYKLPKYIEISFSTMLRNVRQYDYRYVDEVDSCLDLPYEPTIYIENTGLKGEELQKQIKEAIDAYVKEHLYVHS